MKNKKDEKWLDETISRAVDFGKVKFDAEQWKEKYILNESAKNTIVKHHKNVWRYIMENKVTKYSAAAVVALAIKFSDRSLTDRCSPFIGEKAMPWGAPMARPASASKSPSSSGVTKSSQ